MPSHYKLVDGTLEIDGIRMHQTKNKSPLKDAEDKVKRLGVHPGMKALDVCTGLGYCAIEMSKKGALVTTIEIDADVVDISKKNPDSMRLFNNENIQRFLGDAAEFVKTLPDASFHAVSHDPPRLSLAGELYAEAFYRELFRVLKRRGKLFHYVGSPGKKGGKNVARGVQERLSHAGFQGIRWADDVQGFVAVKP
ncbi:methyltransferase domain-containing protein [Candidatus Micrarchaeota archaeon]|nr:methyltransferase domain-containing protein [Candidatus Micrarchaeota archaeon]